MRWWTGACVWLGPESGMRVAITGAAGRIGRILRARLPAGEFDVVPISRASGIPGGRIAELSDLDGLTAAMRGCDALVHLAANPSPEATWDAVLADNVIGTRNAFEAARRAGVRRLVFASSNHVVGMFEELADPDLYALDDPRQLDHHAELRADSLYGVTKAFGEVLARYLVDHNAMAAVCLRIGSVVDAPDPAEAAPGEDVWSVTPPEERARLRATWLSHADTARLVAAALRAPTRWAIVYGTSGNPRQIWDLEHAREAIAYVPRDAAPRWLWAAEEPGVTG